jgi:hypothetical protein
VEKDDMKKKLSRRDFMKIGAVGTLGVAAVTAMQSPTPNIHNAAQQPTPTPQAHSDQDSHIEHGGNMTVGDVDTKLFDPMKYLTDFDTGKVSKLPNGQTLHEWDVFAVDQEIEIAPGIFFPAWAYGLKDRAPQVPGPTFRCNEGDRLRFNEVISKCINSCKTLKQ